MKKLTNKNKISKIILGTSACLVGQKVRYDGSSKSVPFFEACKKLSIEFQTFCPEMEAGMGVPREAIRLQKNAFNEVQVKTSRTQIDQTEVMNQATSKLVTQDFWSDLSGIVLKSSSPSCGLNRVKVYDLNGSPQHNGIGIFAQAVMEKFPNLPIEEEGRLNDIYIRENFLEAVYSRFRLTLLIHSNPKPNDLMVFHAQHKYSLMARSPKILKELGQIVASTRANTMDASLENYEELFMKAFKQYPERKHHINVLLHLVGYFKTFPMQQKIQLHEAISGFAKGQLALSVPIKMLAFMAKSTNTNYLVNQFYFNPFPSELRVASL